MNKQIRHWQLIPFIAIFTLPLLIDAWMRHNFRYFLAYLISIFIALGVRALFNIKPFWFVVISFPFLWMAFAFDVLVIEYRSHISLPAWQIFFETNNSEMGEFISGLNIFTKAVIVLQLLTYLFYLFFAWNKDIIRIGKKQRKIILVILLLLAIDYVSKGATRLAFPLRSLSNLYLYVDTKMKEAHFLEEKKKTILHAVRNKEFKDDVPETVIIVIGESLRRDHLGYYGYHRNTTPYLDKENLFRFTDVVSPANQTISSLMRVFTPAEALDIGPFWKSPSFIKAFKEAGFHTYWISNQRMYGRHESNVSFVGEEADEFISVRKIKPEYDEKLLPALEKVLADKYSKRVVFLHFMGNHYKYNKRYPPEFNVYEKEKTEDKRMHLINVYDNAVRYNDYILHRILEKLKQQKGEKSFIMFSDHGESLYDTPGLPYHGSAQPSKSEYNVPLVLWFSDEYKNKHSALIDELKTQVNQPVIFSDAYHALPYLLGISFDGQKPEKIFFSKNYLPVSQRKVINLNLDLLDYDSLPDAQNHNELIEK